jgi:NarL family two-component system response regulator LiaR
MLAAEAAQALIRQATDPPPSGHGLSPRERQVLTLMTRGLSNRTIAERLVITGSTVEFHVSNILAKLGVGSRTEAVALALRRGITE